MLGDAAHIVAINQYAALSYIVEAFYKAGNSAFARTGRPYNRQGLPGIDMQVKIFQHRQIGAVPECNIAEFNLTAYLGQRLSLWTIHYIDRHIQDLKNPSSPSTTPLQLRI